MSYRERLGHLPDFSMGSRFNPNALIAAGLPIAPIVEHGSWQTNEPDILRWDIRRGVGQATPPPAAPGNCPPGYNVVSSPPDSAGNTHPYCERGKTAFLYDAIGVVKQIPGAYVEMARQPTAGWAPARITALGAGTFGAVGLATWIVKGRSAPTSVKVGTPIAILASLAGAVLRNGFISR